LSAELATTTVVAGEIRPSARRHGISDDDIRHAIETDDQDYVIHAMTARSKYLSMLETPGGDQS